MFFFIQCSIVFILVLICRFFWCSKHSSSEKNSFTLKYQRNNMTRGNVYARKCRCAHVSCANTSARKCHARKRRGIFPRLAGSGYIFWGKISCGSANRLTPLVTMVGGSGGNSKSDTPRHQGSVSVSVTGFPRISHRCRPDPIYSYRIDRPQSESELIIIDRGLEHIEYFPSCFCCTPITKRKAIENWGWHFIFILL